MMEYNKYIQSRDGSLVKELSSKDDSAVLLLQRPDSSLYVLRMYTREIPAYQEILGHDCVNLPQVYSCESRDGFFFVEEEYINGIALSYMLESGAKMNEVRACEIASAVCEAGNFLHTRRFIHRDIKPEHVLLTEDGRIVLVDLDASMRIVPTKANDTQLLGTATYAAPEQFGLIRCDERTDIYAIGILLNEMLTGVHPSVKLYSDGALGQVINKCTNISPDNRYQNLQQLISDLHLASPADLCTAGVSSSPGNSQGKLPIKGKRKLVIGLVTVLICAGGFGLYSMYGNNSGDVPPVETPAGPAMVKDTEYLQLYMDGGAKTYYNFRQGSQSAPLFTEDGERLDQSYDVYTDDNIGFVQWDERRGDWMLVSEGKMPGETGFLYAEKDDKKYAIRVLIFGEPICVYTELPNIDDLAKGYVLSEIDPQNPMRRTIEMTYSADKPLKVYLVASPGFTFDSLACESNLVTIENAHSQNYTYPVKALTFTNPDGGDAEFTVKSDYNFYIFKMTEQ